MARRTAAVLLLPAALVIGGCSDEATLTLPTPTGLATPQPIDVTVNVIEAPPPKPKGDFDAWLSARATVVIRNNLPRGSRGLLRFVVDWWIVNPTPPHGRKLAGTKVVVVSPETTVRVHPDCFLGGLYVVRFRDGSWEGWWDYGRGDEGCIWGAAYLPEVGPRGGTACGGCL